MSSNALSEPATPQEQGQARTPAEPPTTAAPAGSHVDIATPARRARFLSNIRRRIAGYVVSLASIAMGVLLWHLASTYSFDFVVNFSNVPTPATVWAQLSDLLQTSEFYVHIAVSLKRILFSYALGAFIGIPIGVLMGRSKWMHHVLFPHIEILRPIPAVAWIPLAILVWPTEEASIVFITFLGAFFPIVLNTVHGVEQTPEVLVRAGRCMGAGSRSIFWHVVIPAAMPSITAGLAIGMGVAWFSLLAGEIISGQYGIGYFTWEAYSLVRYPNIIIGMIVIGALGLISTALVKLATRPLLKWQPKGRP
jgi:NitT/TauT family transport system permease protein